MLSRKANRGKGPRISKQQLTVEGNTKQIEIVSSPIRLPLSQKRYGRKSASQSIPSPRAQSPLAFEIKLPQKDLDSIQKIVIENFKSAINASNGVCIIPPKNKPSYRFYIGPGNNRQQVKRLMMTRLGWRSTKNPHKANMVWSQWIVQEYMKKLPMLKST